MFTYSCLTCKHDCPIEFETEPEAIEAAKRHGAHWHPTGKSFQAIKRIIKEDN